MADSDSGAQRARALRECGSGRPVEELPVVVVMENVEGMASHFPESYEELTAALPEPMELGSPSRRRQLGWAR